MTLEKALVRAVRARVEEMGLDQACAWFGLEERTIVRVLAGVEVSRGTEAILKGVLKWGE